MGLQIRRGTNTQRLAITPESGELIYTVDTQKVYIGDGNTVGGLAVSGSGIALTDLSVTDSGGDGSLSYNNTNGVFTYTGPSAAEVRAHFSAGTGISITNGQIAIGQAVGTTSDVTFNNLTVSGNLTISGTSTTVNTETVAIADNIVVLNSNATGAPSENAGIEVERGDGDNVSLRWNETSDIWQYTNDGTNFYDIGSNSVPINTQSSSYQLVSTDHGKCVSTTSGVTVPASVFSAGQVISIFNNSSSSITITTSAITAYKSGTDGAVASITLATRGVATILFISATVAVVSGDIT
jgi:hypothetical protein